MKSKRKQLLLAFCILGVMVTTGWLVVSSIQQATKQAPQELSYQHLRQLPDRSVIALSTPERKLQVEVANSLESITQGLSGRDQIGRDGMLFILPERRVPSFWMKEMKFNLDMVWIDDGKVIDVTRDVPAPPPTIPQNQLPVYSPRTPVTMVLEVPAGMAAREGFEVGRQVQFMLK